MATAAPLMPKATAVWLLDNTALSFDQIAEFCKLHPLEVKAIADGDAAQGIKGLDPILTGQLTREQIAEAEKNPEARLKLTEPKVAVPTSERSKKGPRYTPVSRRQDRPNAILWLVRNHPELKDSCDHAPRRHDEVDDRIDPRAHALELGEPRTDGPGDARPSLADRPRPRSATRQQGKAVAGRHRRNAAAGCRNDGAKGSRSRRRRGSRRKSRPNSTSVPCSPSSSSSAAKARRTASNRG